MEQVQRRQLTLMRAIVTFVIAWFVLAAAVYVLQLVTWPKDELQCRINLMKLDKAVQEYNASHPNAPLTEDIPQAMIDQLGIQTHDSSGKEIHYYFLAPSPHGGVMAKCNAHEINPISLEILGVTILAVIATLLLLSYQGFSIFVKEGS